MEAGEENGSTVCLETTVVAGRGRAASIRSKDVVHLSEMLGVDFLNGSLNLIARSPFWLDTQRAVYDNKAGYWYWHAFLGEIPVILSRWGGPAHVFEIYSEFHLRTELSLKDSDIVMLSIPRSTLNTKESKRIINRCIWKLIWRYREPLYYKSDGYVMFVELLGKYTWRSNQF